MIEEAVLQRVLGSALKTGGEFAEVFAEDRRNSSALLDDGRVEELTSGPRPRRRHPRRGRRHHRLRPHRRPQPRPACWPPPRPPRPRPRAAEGAPAPSPSPVASASRGYDIETYPGDVPKARKVELLTRADEIARSVGGAISQVSVSYGDNRRRILVANSDGLLAEDDTVRSFFAVSCVATGDTGMQTGRESIGHTVGFELFDMYDVDELARRAADRALTKLAARRASSSTSWCRTARSPRCARCDSQPVCMPVSPDGHGTHGEQRADGVVLGEQAVGVGDEDPPPVVAVARRHLGDGRPLPAGGVEAVGPAQESSTLRAFGTSRGIATSSRGAPPTGEGDLRMPPPPDRAAAAAALGGGSQTGLR